MEGEANRETVRGDMFAAIKIVSANDSWGKVIIK